MPLPRFTALPLMALIALPAMTLPSSAEPITIEAIETATFASWGARVSEREAVARTAEADPTLPEPEMAEAGEGAAPTSAEEVRPTGSAGVGVTGAPETIVETPSYSTDIPDAAGLTNLDEPDIADPFLIRLQVLLGRANASPGVIDGFLGENTRKAIRSYEAMRGLPVDGEPDEEMWTVLSVDTGQAAMSYTITQEDIDGRYVEDIPSDYGEMAEMEWLGYSGPAEMLAERFHMDVGLLRTLNPDASFDMAGESLTVADTGEEAGAKVTRIAIDKAAGLLTAYGEDGAIVFAAPATVGSPDTPSPSGMLTVLQPAPNPTYSYDPELNFQQGENAGKLTIPAGPNGPVGSMWIDLSMPTFGIHGTAEPTLIDKSNSHGCVRLTNWDAQELAALVVPDETQVEFLN